MMRLGSGAATVLALAVLAHTSGAQETPGTSRRGSAATVPAPRVTLSCTGTAVAADVLAGKTFSNDSAQGLTGTMPNVGSVTLVPGRTDKPIAAGYHDGTGVCAGDPDLKADNIKVGVNIFGVWGRRRASKPLRTGQTTCYDAVGTEIACAGTGQDGELHRGAVRVFKDFGDGTVMDQQTGLMWEKLSDDGSIHDVDNLYTWTGAYVQKIASLNDAKFAGYKDWRLPNRFELETLLDIAAASPATYAIFDNGCADGCTVLTCNCTQSDRYWSSSTYESAPANAWHVPFTDGRTNIDGKLHFNYVRGVRAGN